jgi:hypothetical protein
MRPNSFPHALAIFCILPLAPVVRADAPSAAEERIIELYKSGKLFVPRDYGTVRTAFAELFQEKYQEAIRQAFAVDFDDLTAWLKARPKVRETLYTAIDDRWDRPQKVLTVFHELRQQFPKQIEKYSNLAIATAIVWSDPALRAYDYEFHAVRTKSKLRGTMADAISNFRYLVENDNITEGRLRSLPWEFLVYVVDNRTPIAERAWAQGYYQRSQRLSSWHKDVPYDTGMLEGLTPRLKGRDYTLENIRNFGGVCAMQADFAARVAKSVGIPALYCRGDSAYRGGHAWWMYVAVQKSSADKLAVKLISDGRLAGFEKDMFYTGQVLDPRTGREMLDRDLERRLSVIGRDLGGTRQADLIVRAYPWLTKRLDLNLKKRVTYLDRCLNVSPQNEDCWTEFARLARSGELESDAEKRIARNRLFSLCQAFPGSPDFIWRLFDDLMTVQPSADARLTLYRQALALFEKPSLHRADLACEARLKITQELCAQGNWQLAGRGLMATIRKFPTEGRYVPRMTKKLQDISEKYKGGVTDLAGLYLEVIPALRDYYQGKGEFLAALFDQAKKFLHDNGLAKQEATLKAKVGPLRSQPKIARARTADDEDAGGAAAGGLIKLILDSTDPEERAKAAQALSKRGPVSQVERDIAGFIKIFADKNTEPRLRLFVLHVFYANQRTLRAMPQVSKALTDVLSEPKGRDRSLPYQTAAWLGMTEGPDTAEIVVDTLLELLKGQAAGLRADPKNGRANSDSFLFTLRSLRHIGAARVAGRNDVRQQLQAIIDSDALTTEVRTSAEEFLRELKTGGKKK